MRKIVTIITTAAMALALFASSALAGGHEWEHAEPHPHAMLLRVDITNQTYTPIETPDGTVDAWTVTITFNRCAELSASDRSPRTSNGALPTPAHHHSVHTGNAGGSFMVQGPLYEAGNWVFPLAPFHGVPFEGCDDFDPEGTTFLSPFPLQG